QPHMHAGRILLRSLLDLIAEPWIHRPRLGARNGLDLASARTRPIRLVRQLAEGPFESGEPIDVRVAELDLHLGTAGYHRGCVRLDHHAPDRPYRTRTCNLWKAVVDARR